MLLRLRLVLWLMLLSFVIAIYLPYSYGKDCPNHLGVVVVFFSPCSILIFFFSASLLCNLPSTNYLTKCLESLLLQFRSLYFKERCIGVN